jgi:5S rRNA maturation endonuclease (ribonuclease M5)
MTALPTKAVEVMGTTTPSAMTLGLPRDPSAFLAPPSGVPADAWLRIARRDGELWAIDERDETGAIIGTAYRRADGSKSSKKGGKRGLIVDWPLSAYAGTSKGNPLFVCEGASDTAALLGLGLDAIGVPMAGANGEALAELVKDRHVVLMTDSDTAGRRGSETLSRHIVGRATSVRVISPPHDVKDARDAVIAGASREDFLALAAAAEPCNSSQSLRNSGDRIEYGLVSIADLGPAEEPDWLWPGFIALGGITLLTGLWKAGKTTLLGYLLRDLYRGSGLAQAVLDAPVIMVSEEAPGLWANRRDELGLSKSIYFIKRPSHARPNRAEWQRLIAQVKDHVLAEHAGLVVFDTLPSVWPVVEENSAGETIDALTPLRDLTEAGAAVLLIAHPRKSDGEEATATRGSGALTGFVDVIVELRRFAPQDAKDSRRVLKAYGRFDSIPAKTVLELGPDGYRVLEGGAAVTEDYISTISTLIPMSGPGLTRDEVLDQWPKTALKPGRTLTLSLLNRGFTDGRWSRRGKGTRGSPFTFVMEPPDSIQSPPTPSGRIESGRDSLTSIHNPKLDEAKHA